MKFKRRHGEFEQGCVLSESYTATDALPSILPACHQSLLPACAFVTRDTIRHLRLFLGKFVREPICSWWAEFMNRGSAVCVFVRVRVFSNTSLLKVTASTKPLGLISSENVWLHYQRWLYTNTYRPSDEAFTPPLTLILILLTFLPLLFILTVLWSAPLKEKHNYFITKVFPVIV
jgi:hypothetical protein